MSEMWKYLRQEKRALQNIKEAQENIVFWEKALAQAQRLQLLECTPKEVMNQYRDAGYSLWEALDEELSYA